MTDPKKHYVLQEGITKCFVSHFTILASGYSMGRTPSIADAPRHRGGPELDRIVARAAQFVRIRAIEVKA